MSSNLAGGNDSSTKATKQPARVIHTARVRPRVRVNTGCLRCRYRRIKCDEHRPICSACKRVNLYCLWEDPQKGNRHLLPGNKHINSIALALRLQAGKGRNFVDPFLALDSKLAIRANGNGYAPIRDQEEQNLYDLAAAHLSSYSPTTTSSPAKIPSHGVHMLAIGLESLWVRDAVLSYTAFVHSCRDTSLQTQMYLYYNRAVKHLRENIGRDNSRENKERILVACCYLSQIEVNELQSKISPMMSLEGIGRLFSGRDPLSLRRDSTVGVEQFHCYAFELYLYGISMLSFFYPEAGIPADLSYDVDISSLEDTSEQVEPRMLRFGSTLSNVMLKLNRLARSVNKVEFSNNQSQLSRLGQRLNVVLTYTRTNLRAVNPETNKVMFMYWNNRVLSALCLYIYWSKLSDRALTASSESLRPLMNDALTCLGHYNIPPPHNAGMCWAFMVLICAAHTVREIQTIFTFMDKTSLGLHDSMLSRLQRVLHYVQCIRQQQANGCDQYTLKVTGVDPLVSVKLTDTLDLLLWISQITQADS